MCSIALSLHGVWVYAVSYVFLIYLYTIWVHHTLMHHMCSIALSIHGGWHTIHPYIICFNCALTTIHQLHSHLSLAHTHTLRSQITYPVLSYNTYGVATSSRLLKIIGLFCKKALWKRRFSAKDTSNFKEPTNRSHPIVNGLQPIAFEVSFLRSQFSIDDLVL